MQASRFVATVRVSGLGARLDDFRERVRHLMVRDIDAEHYSEHHAEGMLEYRFEIERGIPFPAFASASTEFPEVKVEAEWENEGLGQRGRAVIENGRLQEQSTGPLEGGRVECGVEMGDAGALRFAIACRPRQAPPADGGGWIGYCVSCDRQTWFAWNGALELIPIESEVDADLLAELEDLAFQFADDWLWFDDAPEEQTALERRRYAERGWPVRGANLKAERATQLGEALPSGRYDNLSPSAAAIRDAARAAWLEER